MTLFAAGDRCCAGCIGIHVIKRAHRLEAAGVRLRHDHGSACVSDGLQLEVVR